MTQPRDSQPTTPLVTPDNRHQYFETAMTSAEDAEREIQQAEARGRSLRRREQESRRKIQNIIFGVVALLFIAAVVVLVRLAT